MWLIVIAMAVNVMETRTVGGMMHVLGCEKIFGDEGGRASYGEHSD